MTLAIARAREIFSSHIKTKLPKLSTTRLSDSSVVVDDELKRQTGEAESRFLSSIYTIVRTQNRFVTLEDLLPLATETNYGGCETCATLVSLLIERSDNEELRELNPQALLYIFPGSIPYYLEEIIQKAKSRTRGDLNNLTPNDLNELFNREVKKYKEDKEARRLEIRRFIKRDFGIPPSKQLTAEDIARVKNFYRKKPGFNESLFDAALRDEEFTVQKLRGVSHVTNIVGLSEGLKTEIQNKKGHKGHMKIPDMNRLNGTIVLDGWLSGEQVLEPTQAQGVYDQWFDFAARRHEMVVALPESDFCKVIHPYY